MYQKILIFATLFLFLGGLFLFSLAVNANENSQLISDYIDYYEESGRDSIYLNDTGSTTVESWSGNTTLQMFNCPVDYPYWYVTGGGVERCYSSCDTGSSYITVDNNSVATANTAPDWLESLYVENSNSVMSTSTYPVQVVSYRVNDSVDDGVLYGMNCDDGDNPIDFFLIWDFENGDLFSDTGLTTLIASTTPVNNTFVATSTDFEIGAGGYLSIEDYNKGGNFHLNITISGLTSFGDTQHDKSFLFSISDYGNFNVSSTTEMLEVGTWEMTTELYRGSTEWTFLREYLDSTSTVFTVSTTTLAYYASWIQGQLISETLYDTENQEMPDCNFDFLDILDIGVGGRIYKCISVMLWSLAFPTTNELGSLWDMFQDEILVKAPFGYGLRIYDVFTATTTSGALVGDNFYVPDDFGTSLDGTTISFGFWSALASVDDYLVSIVPVNQEGEETAYDIVLFYWNFVWVLGFSFWLLRKVLHFR